MEPLVKIQYVHIVRYCTHSTSYCSSYCSYTHLFYSFSMIALCGEQVVTSKIQTIQNFSHGTFMMSSKTVLSALPIPIKTSRGQRGANRVATKSSPTMAWNQKNTTTKPTVGTHQSHARHQVTTDLKMDKNAFNALLAIIATV